MESEINYMDVASNLPSEYRDASYNPVAELLVSLGVYSSFELYTYAVCLLAGQIAQSSPDDE